MNHDGYDGITKLNGNIVHPQVPEWQEEESRRRRGVPVVLFIAVLLLAILGLVFTVRVEMQLERAVEIAEEFEEKYNLEKLEKQRIMKEDTDLFILMLERNEEHKEVFRILQEERLYYKQLVPEEEYYPADSEIGELLRFVLGDDDPGVTPWPDDSDPIPTPPPPPITDFDPDDQPLPPELDDEAAADT